MSHLSRSIAALACAAALPALAGAEDLTVISRTIANQGAPTTATQYITADWIRSSDGESDTIMEVGAGRFTMINHKKKEYYSFTRDEMLASMQKLEQQMAGPAGAMMEKMMGGTGGEVTVQKGASRKVAGYDCTSYTFSLGENLRYEMCATQALQLPPQLYDAMKGSYSMMGPMAKRLDKIFDAMKKVGGLSGGDELDGKHDGVQDQRRLRGHGDPEGRDPRHRLCNPGRLHEEGHAVQEVRVAPHP